MVFVKCVCVCGLHPPRSSDSFRVKACRNHPCFHLVKDECIDNTMIICIVYNIYMYIYIHIYTGLYLHAIYVDVDGLCKNHIRIVT